MKNKFQEIIEEKKKKQKKSQSLEQDNDYSQKVKQLNNLSKKERIKRIYKSLIDNFDIPERFKNKTFENYQPYDSNKKAFKKVKEYAESFNKRFKNGDWLVLTGDFGLGKTHLALACGRKVLKYFAKKYIERNPKSLYYSGINSKIIFSTSSELIQKIRDSYDSDMINEREIMNNYQEVPLLIIDDLGTEKASEWQKEKMYLILDHRYRELLPTIITTNLTTKELKDQVSERVVERIIEAAGEGKYLWKFQGKSYRKK